MGEKTVSFQKRPFPDSEPEIERIRQILFWQFQYQRRNFLQNYDESWIDILSHLGRWQDPQLKNATIRYVSNAILSKINFGESSYDLTQVPRELLDVYYYFILLSMQCGYYHQ